MNEELRLRVVLVVWKPRVEDEPMNLSKGWPRVLQVQLSKDRTVWEPPGVVVRHGELIVEAMMRIASTIGMTLPNAIRVLAVDQTPATDDAPAEIIMMMDGGWCSDADLLEIPDCLCEHERHCGHRRRWATTQQACANYTALAMALGAAVGVAPTFIFERVEEDELPYDPAHDIN